MARLYFATVPRARRRASAPVFLPWIVTLVLIVAGTAVLVARAGPERAAVPSPTPTVSVREAPELAVLAAPTPTALRPTPLPTVRPATAATMPAQRPTSTAAPRATPTVSSTASARPQPQQTGTALVALTFDAGADRGYAEDILDLLHEQHISASFGITGTWTKANPDLVRRMAADGHLIINHSLDHQSFTGVSDHKGGLSPARRRAELEQADELIAPLIGHSTRPWYRLPYGDDDARMAADLAPAGFTRKVGWTIDTLGWRGAPASEIVERSLRLAAPGAVYVLHVGHTSQDGPALERIVTGLRGRGYGFATVESVSY